MKIEEEKRECLQDTRVWSQDTHEFTLWSPGRTCEVEAPCSSEGWDGEQSEVRSWVENFHKIHLNLYIPSKIKWEKLGPNIVLTQQKTEVYSLERLGARDTRYSQGWETIRKSGIPGKPTEWAVRPHKILFHNFSQWPSLTRGFICLESHGSRKKKNQQLERGSDNKSNKIPNDITENPTSQQDMKLHTKLLIYF